MVRRIYINESSVGALKSGRLLPQFVFKALKSKDTSLGRCPSFPDDGGFEFEYGLLKDRFNRVSDAVERFGYDISDADFLSNELSLLMEKCVECERPVRSALENECVRCVDRLFKVPSGLVDMSVELVDSIKCGKAPRVTPEGSDGDYEFEDVGDKENARKSVAKRRFINALLQGASCTYAWDGSLYDDVVGSINPKLPEMYKRIGAINDYLLFTKKVKITDEHLMQGAYVETVLGSEERKTRIRVQGLIFPLLLQDTIRGLFELFSSHGLPSDSDKAEYVVGRADFLAAEPWDVRLGVGLWERIFGGVEEASIVPYMFSELVAMPYEEFNLATREILSGTKKGNRILSDMESRAERDNQYQDFKDRISLKRGEKPVLSDSYFAAGDKSGLDLSYDEEGGEVIEEDGNDAMSTYMSEPSDVKHYQDLVDSATVGNIDFIEGDVNDGSEDLIVTIGGEVVPRAMILLMAQPVKIRVSETQRVSLLQIHIIMDKSIQHRGLAPKIYKKLILEFGGIYCGEGRRINKEHIGRVYDKLSKDPDLYVYHDDMCYIAMLKSEVEGA